MAQHPRWQVGPRSLLRPLPHDFYPNHWCWILKLWPALRGGYQRWRFPRPSDQHSKEGAPAQDHAFLSRRTQGLWRVFCGVSNPLWEDLEIPECHVALVWSLRISLEIFLVFFIPAIPFGVLIPWLHTKYTWERIENLCCHDTGGWMGRKSM